MVRVDGDLDPETGEVLLTALGAVTDAQARGVAVEDWRTAGQRRADALGEICRHFLDRPDRPVVAGERPHMIITADVAALRGEPEGWAELDRAGPIHPRVARRLACDAAVSRVLSRGPSEPLDVGRRMSVVPPSMRRAVVIRDTHCRVPGCDRPQSWCDAHHVVHWADGGPTALSNLILLCRPHHRLVHRQFKVEMVAHRPVFRRPDGTIMEDRAPPVAAVNASMTLISACSPNSQPASPRSSSVGVRSAKGGWRFIPLGNQEQRARWQYVAVGTLVFRIEPMQADRHASLWDSGEWKEYPVPAWQIVSLLGARSVQPEELAEFGIPDERPDPG
jgi:hypothetical protein